MYGIRTIWALTAIVLAGLASYVGAEDKRPDPADHAVPEANLSGFEKFVAPIFTQSCLNCHGPKKSKGKFRVDELDPNLLTGADIDQWVEVYEVLSNSEMPPDDEPDYHLGDEERARIVDWLGAEMDKASQVRRNEGVHTSFRRMANYEYNYALQDLLGLKLEFSEPLPPEAFSEDGFKNSSELLQMSAMQFETYREIALSALKKATVQGVRPEVVTYQIPMQEALDKASVLKSKPINKNDPDYSKKKRATHIFNKETGEGFFYRWTYYVVLDRAQHGIWNLKPDKLVTEVPAVSKVVAVLPPSQQIKLDLGNSVPDEGLMRVRMRVGTTSNQANQDASLRLIFGFQTNNEGKMSARVSQSDVPVTSSVDDPQFITFEFPLNEIPRNPFRRSHEVGSSPNVTEFLEIQNIPNAGTTGGGDPIEVHLDYVEIEAGVYETWPPRSHTKIFFDSPNKDDEDKYSREILKKFMTRAWRRPVKDEDVELYCALFTKYRPEFVSFEETLIEVLATVLAAPEFLYLIQGDPGDHANGSATVSDLELASRLSFFLWSSIPDSALLELALEGKLKNPEVLDSQIERMLTDSRSERFSQNFLEQWLGLEALETVIIDQTKFKGYHDIFKENIVKEPLAFFEEVLKKNSSIMDFLDSDYLMINEALARHYGIPEVYGQEFRKVTVGPESNRGGLLTTAAVMTMNSTGLDSNPLKRGIWMLERILHDPPPPPPPNVPVVDLTDPKILSMTQKERMADHRNQAACRSCHSKIDPWGISLENYDALGSYRTKIKGEPVEATAVLYNKQKLDGVGSMKNYLLATRQDQFARAMVHKLSSYALGRPMSFSDRSEIDKMTRELRKSGDGLKDLVLIVIRSGLFNTKITRGADDE
ncbi:MAG: mono/diheme cytochrome c family protein [Paracoccaceae bacterium]|jgi:mono/diheme cytochrome c family protein